MTSIDNVNSGTANRVQNEPSVAEVQSKSTTRIPPYVPGESMPDAMARTGAPSIPAPANNISHEAATFGLSTMNQNVTFDFSMFSALLIKMDQESEKLARDQIIADVQSVADEMEQAASDMEASAGLALASGIISGTASIVSGGISIAGGFKSYKIVSAAKGNISDGATMMLSQKSQSISLKTQGLSQGVAGLGQVTSSASKFGADYMQSQSKRADASTERRRGELEKARQFADNIHKSAQSMQQALNEVEQMRNRATSEIMTAKA